MPSSSRHSDRQSDRRVARRAAHRVALLLALGAVAACSDAPAPTGTVIIDRVRVTSLTMSIRVASDTIGVNETVGAVIVARNATNATVVERGLQRCPLGAIVTAGPSGAFLQVQLPGPKVGPAPSCAGTVDLTVAPGDSVVQEVALHPVIIVGGDGITPPVPGRYEVRPVLYTPTEMVSGASFHGVTIVVR